MKIDENYRGRIRVQGKPGELMGYMLTVHDADTDEAIENVTNVKLIVGVGHKNMAVITYHDFIDNQEKEISVEEAHEVDVTANCVDIVKAILEKYEIN